MSRYRFIEAEKVEYPVHLMCRVLKVSRAAYYRWSSQPPCARALADAQLLKIIVDIHERSRRTYGSPRIHAELRARGLRCSRKRVARLMRLRRLSGCSPRRFRRTTVPDPMALIPDLVQRDFEPRRPNQLWVADITYIRTEEGWLYLAAILDCFSRRVVGFAMANHLRTELPLTALHMALGNRQPQAGLIHHSDRGCQYSSEAYIRLLELHGVRPSMSRRGNCFDNAVAESFFSVLKRDLVYRTTWATREDARLAIFEYIEAFYNRERRHSTLDHLSPAAFEEVYAA